MSPTMTENPREKRSTEEKLRKERLLDEKMKLIRQKNEERMKRRKEVEEDIRNANTHSEELCGKSTIQPGHNMSGVKSELGKPVSKFRGRARGRILEKMALEKPQAHRFKERQRKNYELVEKELQEEKSSPGLGKSSRFLSDDRRADMSKITSRSSHSWGGSQFEHVRDKINKDQPRRKQDQNMDINMTGKERVRYHEWKDERSKIDQDRTSRQMRGNTWEREWDQSKQDKKGESSFGGKQDQPDRMRSGQRFGERARRKPDWDHHDDRGGDSFTDSIPETTRTHNSKREEMSGKELSENWDEHENTESRQESVCSDSMETTRDVCANKEEDWEEETETTPINIYDNIIQFNQEQNAIVHETDREVQEPEDLPQEEQTHVGSTQEQDTSDTLDITDNFTVTVDPQGKRNVTDKSSETTESSTNKVLNETTLDTNTGENNAEHPRETSSISNELEQESEENQVTEDSCKELVHINTEDDNNVSSSCGGNREEVAETATEFCTNEQSTTQENSSEAGESRPIQESDTAVTEAPTKDMKPKDNLPKLDLTKAKEEPFPDFLKTPQHKDWAECDFDEDELDFSSDLVFYP